MLLLLLVPHSIVFIYVQSSLALSSPRAEKARGFYGQAGGKQGKSYQYLGFVLSGDVFE